jgi:hypothetical protein
MGLLIYEPHGARGLTTLRFSLPVQRIERVDLLEDPADRPAAALGYDGTTVSFDVPLAVVTLGVVLAS